MIKNGLPQAILMCKCWRNRDPEEDGTYDTDGA